MDDLHDRFLFSKITALAEYEDVVLRWLGMPNRQPQSGTQQEREARADGDVPIDQPPMGANGVEDFSSLQPLLRELAQIIDRYERELLSTAIILHGNNEIVENIRRKREKFARMRRLIGI